MVHTFHKAPMKLQILTITTVKLNRSAPGHGEKRLCDKGGARQAFSPLPLRPGPTRHTTGQG